MANSKHTYEPVKVYLEETDPAKRDMRFEYARIALVRSGASILAIVAGAVAWADCFANGAAVLMAIVGSAAALLLHLMDASHHYSHKSAVAAAMEASRQWVSFGLLLASVLLAMLVPPFSTGMQDVVNQTIYSLNEAFNAYIPLISSAGTPTFNLAAIPLGILSGLIAWVLVKRNMAILLTLWLGLILAGCIWLYPHNALACLACCAISWMCGWSLCVRHLVPSAKNLLAIFLRSALSAAFACGLALLYTPAVEVDQLCAGIVEAVDDARYGSDTLPEGDVAHSTTMNQGDEERLSVSFTNLPDESTYLRGFVGANYQDSIASWSALDHTAYEGDWQGLFTWLANSGFDASTQYATCMEINEQVTGQPAFTWAATVKVTGANRRYVYTPASQSTLSGSSTISGRDGATLAASPVGASGYTFESVGDAVDLDTMPVWLEQGAETDEAQAYLDSESVYHAFVEDEYLEISDEERALVNELFYNDETWNPDGEPSTYSVVSRVRIMLSTLASYSETPQAYAGEEGGFVNWFLTQAREGNSAYFSTAAVQAFRAQGIPARYVEGYLLDADTLQEMANTGEKEATLTSQDAHAWVEIYLDGEGWVPVDVTPGFYTQPFTAQNVIPVNQETSSGESSQAGEDGAVMGDIPDNSDDQDDDQAHSAQRTILGFILLAVLCAIVGLCAQEIMRKVAQHKLIARLDSTNQATAVRANYDLMSLLILAAGVAFDSKRPLDATEEVARTFDAVRPEEYERAVHLYQKAVFGKVELRPHEMRTIEHFNLRLEEEMPETRGLRMRMRNRYRYLQ